MVWKLHSRKIGDEAMRRSCGISFSNVMKKNISQEGAQGGLGQSANYDNQHVTYNSSMDYIN